MVTIIAHGDHHGEHDGEHDGVPGGFLFSVVTPSNSLVSLGLSITAGPTLGMQEVSLYLTPLNKLRSEPLVVFTIPALATTWNRLAVMVKGSSVKLFVNCQHTESLAVTRPHSLHFDPASSLYIGQGGSGFKKPWEGVLQVNINIFTRLQCCR